MDRNANTGRKVPYVQVELGSFLPETISRMKNGENTTQLYNELYEMIEKIQLIQPDNVPMKG